MFNVKPFARRTPAALLIAMALSACGGGGGGGGGTPAPTPIPTARADVVAGELNKPATLAVMSNDSVTANGKLKLVSATAAAHGSVVISGDNLVYTPAAGFFGKDSFSYTVKDVGAGTATATAEVTVNVTAKLTLSGKTVDLPGTGNVTIAIGSTLVNTTTDATGAFSAPVTLDTPASMITVTAQGSGTYAFIKLISQVGDSQHAVAALGAGTTLTPAQLPGLNVTAITTSLYANTVLRNGGVVPATQASLDGSAARVGWHELSQTAVALRALTGKAGAAPTQALPAGATDTLALVLNRTLYGSMVNAFVDEEFTGVNYAMSADTRLGSVPSLLVDKSKSLALYNNTGCCGNPVPELVLHPDGSGSYSHQNERHAGTWRKDDALTFTLTTPLVREDVYFTATDDYEVIYTLRQIKILQTTGGASSGNVHLTRVETMHFPRGELPNGPAENTSEPFAFAEWSTLAAPLDVAGTMLAGLLDPASSEQTVPRQIAVAFAADGSATSPQLPGQVFSWRMQDGRLVIDYGNGQLHMLVRVRASADGEERWLLRAGVGADYAMHEIMVVKAQPGLAFTEANAVQRWRSGPTSLFFGTHTLVNVQANLLALELAEAVNGTLSTTRTSAWTIEDGKLAMRSYRLPNGQTATACPAGQTCTLRSERIWTLVRNDADRITVLEAIYSAQQPRQRLIQYSRN